MPNFIKTTACGLMQLKTNTPSSLEIVTHLVSLDEVRGNLSNPGSAGTLKVQAEFP
jgi:hypothetical protein